MVGTRNGTKIRTTEIDVRVDIVTFAKTFIVNR